MTNNQDARPFVDLKKDAAEFRTKFDEDIKECLSFLDAKITALICEPDSFISGRSIHQNALAEFSKAKYSIFMGVKNLINAKEREWLDYIAEMKKLFIENVEIFLAGTKLEVKLPPPESKSSQGLGSSFLEKRPSSSFAKSKANVGEKTQFNRRGRLSASSIKLSNTSYEEEMDVEEFELDRSQSRSSSGTRSGKLSNSGLNTSRSSSGRRSSLKREMDIGLNSSRSSSERRSSLKKEMDHGLNTSQSSSERRSSLKREIDLVRGHRGRLTEVNAVVENDSVDLHLKKGGRKQATKSMKVAAQNNSCSTTESEDQATDAIEEVPLKGRKGRSAPKSKTNVAVKNSSCSTNESEDQTTEITQKEVNLKGRKGRSAVKAKTNVIDQNNISSTDENENKTVPNEKPLKGRKGRSAAKTKTSGIAVVPQNYNKSSDENEGQTIENEISFKGRKGRSAAKAKTNVVVQNSNNSSENEDQIDNTVENEVPLKKQQGRSAPKVKTNVIAQNRNTSDENEGQIGETIENEILLKRRKGRSAPKAKTNVVENVNNGTRNSRSTVLKNISHVFDQNVAQKVAVRGRKAVKPVVEEIYDPGPSKSPKKVSFGGDTSSSEEYEQTPLARPVKTAARRKTLLPKLDIVSGADIIPGAASLSKLKRKTIGGVAELETVAPSKRLKTGKKAIPSQEEDSASDNLLESDDNYSEWMSLKSVDGKIPTRPAIYEVKVWRAKKTAYIGSCENLRQKLTLYNLRQNSGHKHLDKFIDRNYNEIQVRFEISSSFNDAKQEAKNRIDSFKAQHKNPPAYN